MSEPKRMTHGRLAGLKGRWRHAGGDTFISETDLGDLFDHIDALTAEPSRLEDTEVAEAIERVAHQCSNPPVPDDYHLIGTVTAGDLRLILAHIRRLAAAKASAERERDSMDLSYAPVLARALAAEAKLAREEIERLKGA